MATKKASAKKKASAGKSGGAAKKAGGAAKKAAAKKGGAKKTAAAAGPTIAGAADSPGEQIVSADIRSSYIMGNTFGMKEVTYTAKNGDAIFEGDIVLGSVEEMEQVRKSIEEVGESEETEGIARSIFITGSQFRWPDGVVPFRIDPALPNQQRVTDAIAHWEANTNIDFRPRTTEPDFVTFRPAGGCSAHVGRRGGEQFVNLAAGCTLGNTIHEIGHVVGIWHEQSREDRDNFVQIVFSNIQPDAVHNFNQHITDGDDVGPYDYGSIMHYPANAFAINPNQPTIIAPQPIGQRNGLSAGDIAAVNKIYPRKVTLGDTSTNGPALVNRGSELLLGWTGSGNLQLNFMRSTTGLTWGNKVTLGEVSPASPALAVFNNRYVVAWIGVGNNRLNIMQSSNGMSWGNKVTLGDTSQSAPALAVFNNRLYIAWRGVGNNQLNVMRSTDGINWSGKVTLGDTTTSGPALAQLGTQLLLGWRGVGNNQLNVMRSSNGSTFAGKVTLGDTTVSKPYLHVDGGRALLSWQGVGNQRLNVLTSVNGANWGNKFTSNETCIDGPALATLGNRLAWGWAGTDAAHRLNVMLFNVV